MPELLESLTDADVVAEAVDCRRAAESLEEDFSARRWQEAAAYAELSRRGWSVRRIASECGVSKSAVGRLLQAVSRYRDSSDRPSFWTAYAEVTGEKPRIARSTGEHEWYTPPKLVEAARAVLGTIDLDPASCEVAQRVVKAEQFFTAEEDGLSKPWGGNLWVNPPYTCGLVNRFVAKLCDHVEAGDVPAAVLLTNNATETAWSQRALRLAAALCFSAGRVRFLNPELKPVQTPLQGQVVIYFGGDTAAFVRTFRPFGVAWRLDAAVEAALFERARNRVQAVEGGARLPAGDSPPTSATGKSGVRWWVIPHERQTAVGSTPPRPARLKETEP
jgi:hypothetical protein